MLQCSLAYDNIGIIIIQIALPKNSMEWVNLNLTGLNELC